MPRPRQHIPLQVLLNNRPVGRLEKESSGAIYFRYDESWLAKGDAIPVSLSLPLREDAYRGERVTAVFENLLPDSDLLRRRIAEKVGARGTDAYSLLSEIGRDCVGALQFIPAGEELPTKKSDVAGKAVSDREVEQLLANLARAPLGLDREQDFRISVAGAQEKTALLRFKGKWLKPLGTTPTTHILKPQIGALPNGLDLSNSVENEFYCLRLMGAFGLPVAAAEMKTFGSTKTLVVERFDRRWVDKKQLLRLPQEDCCQALGCPPSRKYQNEGGPGIVDILKLLKAADAPAEDQQLFLKSQIIFWLIGATDGHAKNASIFLGPEGRFQLTPFYDVLSAQPSLDSRQIERKQMKLAMSVGDSRHYRVDEIRGRHFVQTAMRAGLSKKFASETLDEVFTSAKAAFDAVVAKLPADFPIKLHASIEAGALQRLRQIGLR
jgi:serine/threonine-protein kinase HipA